MLGIYVHIPFCKRICSYCDFCKMLYKKEYVSRYLESLRDEIKSKYKGELVNSIYIGGGTPSSLDEDELIYLLDMLTIFNLSDNYEYTIEFNVNDIDINKINILKSYGVNRVSVGVESFDKETLKILNRSHDSDMVFDNIYLLKKYFDNINIDLIYGVTDDINKVKDDLRNFFELDIPHLSYYSLIIEEHTKLYIDKHKYISEDIDREMYEYIGRTLEKKGYIHYEISNYAKPGYESIHNKNYWLNGSYYGFGLGAVGYIDNYRISNTKNLSKYLIGKYINLSEYENEDIRKENDLILGLRLIEGIDINKFNIKYNDDLLTRKTIKELIDKGYLEVVNGHIRCKNEYLYLENSILDKIIGEKL